MDWTPVWQMFLDYPEILIVIGAFIGTHFVEIVKARVPGRDGLNLTTVQKRIAAAVPAVGTAVAYALVTSGNVDIPRVIVAFGMAWFVSTGYHTVGLQGKGTRSS